MILVIDEHRRAELVDKLEQIHTADAQVTVGGHRARIGKKVPINRAVGRRCSRGLGLRGR
jgi:hypothetical protein